MKIKPGRLCILLVSVAVLNGCAVFRLKDIPPVTLKPAPADRPKPSIGFDLLATSSMFKTEYYPENQQRKMRKAFADTLIQSAYFSTVSQSNKNTDVFLKVQLDDSGSPIALVGAFITGYTFGIIPSWSTLNQKVTVTLENPDTTKTYVAKDRARMVMWLPMIVLLPSHGFSEATVMQQNMYRDILQRMEKDGVLVKKEVINPDPPKEAPVVNTTVTENAVASSAIQ